MIARRRNRGTIGTRLAIPCLGLLLLSISGVVALPLRQGKAGLSSSSSPTRRRPMASSPYGPARIVGTSSTSTTQLYNGMWSRDDDLEGVDKYRACVPYLLPLLDGEKFGKYIYESVPPLGFLDSLFIGPLHETYAQFDWLGLLLFCALTLGTRFNTEMDRNVRFNAQQAAMISAALVIPELIAYSFVDEDIPRYIVQPCCNFVWYTYMSMVLYSVYSNLRGKKPDEIPYISNLSEMLVGPF